MIRSIAVNTAYQLAPWADLLYAADGVWWRHHAGAAGFAGQRVTVDKGAAAEFGLSLASIGRPPPKDGSARSGQMLFDRFGVLGDGGNSGFQAVNLAAQAGARRIILLGFDMTLAAGVHWHGRHPAGLNNPTAQNLARWRRHMDEAAPTLAALGIEVINASMSSALTAYPKMSLEDALQ